MEFKTNTTDLSHKTIKNLFFEQIKRLSVKKSESLDMQFSDMWNTGI